MAVVTTFGKPSVQEASGLHFKVPLIQQVTKISKAITGMQIGYTTDPERAEGCLLYTSGHLHSTHKEEPERGGEPRCAA